MQEIPLLQIPSLSEELTKLYQLYKDVLTKATYTYEDLVDILRLSRPTLSKYVKEGKLKYIPVGSGRNKIFPLHYVLEFLFQRDVEQE